MEAKLIVISGKANKNEVALKLPCTIGRSREADLTIGHPMVSRQHCELSESEGVVLIRDLGSLNGTFVNGERVSESRLDPSAEVTVGPLTFRVDFEYAAPEQAEEVAFEAIDEAGGGQPSASSDVADTADFSGLLKAGKADAPAAKEQEEERGEDTDFFAAIDADSPPAVPSSAGAYDVSEDAAEVEEEKEEEEEEEVEPTPPPPSGAKARISGKGGVKDDRASSAQPVKPRANPDDDYGVASEAEEGDEEESADDDAGEDETVPQKAAGKDNAKKQKKGWWPFAGKGKEKKGAEKPAEEPEDEPAAKAESKPAAKPAAKAAPKPAPKPAVKSKPAKKSDEDLAFEALLDDGDSKGDDSEGGDASLGFLKND